MNPANMVVAFVAIFGLVFGGMYLVLRIMDKRNAAAAEAAGDDEAARRGGDEPTEDEAFTKRLRQAGIYLTPEVYRRRVVRVAMLMGGIGLIMGGFGIGGLIFGGLLGFIGYKGGDFYIDWRYNGRLNEFMDQLTDALSVMANGVKSGQTILQTLETIAADFQDPIRIEIEEVLSELRMGVPMDVSLAAWAERLPCEDLEITTTALIVQRQTGGNVAEILETVATTIRERNKLYKQIKTLTTQGRMSGIVLALLPVGLFLAMFLIAPQRTGLLLSHPIGLVMTGIGTGAITLGGYFIKRIVTIEV